MSTPVIATPSSLAMARSPQFITGKNNTLANDTLNAMTIDLRIRTGVLSASGSANFSITKNYSIDEVINFEVSDFVRAQFAHDFDFITDTLGYSQSPIGEALWVVPTGSWIFSNNGASPSNATFPDETETAYAYLTTDGWRPRNDLQPTEVTQPVLATSRNRQVLASNYEVLGIYNSAANDLDRIDIAWNGGTSYSLYTSISSTTPPDPTTQNTQDLVIYAGVGPANLQNNTWINNAIKPSNFQSGDYYDVMLFDSGDIIIASVRYYLVCEPKYTPYQIAFINRYGVADYITFFKRSDERGTFVEDKYQKSIYNDGFTTPSTEIGKYQSYNVNSRNSLTLNTGFVDQDYDETIKDILMSEYVAVLDGSDWVSVVPERGSVEYQKHVNQKLINYTLSFTYGFDERSLVR
jgi:hypothetical protein